MRWSRPPLYYPDSTLCHWLIVATLTLCSMGVIIDLLSSVMLLTEIQGFLAIDDTKTTWIGKAFFFMAAIAPLYSTHMANIYGFKKILLAGLLVFLCGAISSGAVSTYPLMVFCRGLAGAGGGTVLAVALVYIPRVLPKEMINPALTAFTNVYFGLGIAIGLLMGGYFAQEYHWRMAFFMNIHAAPFLLLSLLLFLPETEKIKRPPFDFLSFFSLTFAFLALFMIVINAKAPWNTLGWNSPFIHGCTLISLSLFALFLYTSATKENPLILLHLFKRLSFSIACLGMVVVGFMVFGVTLSSMDIFEEIYLYQRWTIGWFVSTLGFIYFFFGIIPTVLANHLQPRIFIIIGLSLIILSCFMSQQLTIQSTLFEIGALQTMRAIGVALVLGPLTVLALENLNEEETAKTSAMIGALRFMAATFGSSIIELIMRERTPYHALRFGEQVDIYSAKFQRYIGDYQLHLIDNTGSTPLEALKQARLIIIENIQAQAIIASLNDAIYILGWATVAIFLLIGAMMGVRIRRRMKS